MADHSREYCALCFKCVDHPIHGTKCACEPWQREQAWTLADAMVESDARFATLTTAVIRLTDTLAPAGGWKHHPAWTDFVAIIGNPTPSARIMLAAADERNRFGGWLEWFVCSASDPLHAHQMPFRTLATDALLGEPPPARGAAEWQTTMIRRAGTNG